MSSSCIGVRNLEPPPDQGAKSVLIVFRDAKETVVYATDVGSSLAASLPPFGGSADARDIFIVEYACPLATLGLSPGAQTLGAGRPTYLPRPLAAFERAGSDQWRESSIVPEALAEIVPERNLDCPTVSTVEVPAYIHHGVGLDDGSVLVGAGEGVFYRVPPGGSAVRQNMLSGRYVASHRIGDQIWVSGQYGELAHGSIDGGFISFAGASLTEKTEQLWFDGSVDGAPFELYRVDPHKGSFARAVDPSWQQLDTVPPRTPILAGAGVAWVGPGEAVAVGAYRFKHFREGEAVISIENAREEPDLSAVADIPGIGIVIGGAGGLFYQPEGDVLRRIGDTQLGDAINAIAPLGTGFILVTPGRTLYWNGAIRDCLSEPIVGFTAVKRLPAIQAAAVLQRSNVSFLEAPDLAALESACSEAQ